MSRITFQLIVKTQLPTESLQWSEDKMIEELDYLTHVRLDRMNIGYIDNLELMSNSLTNLYLQHNRISTLENLECLSNLKTLIVSHNEIQVIEGIQCLTKLGFLDLSCNNIGTFDIDEFPQSLVILNLAKNPCTAHEDHRGRIVQDLEKLRNLDGREITKQERSEAGYVVSSSEEESDGESSEDETENNETKRKLESKIDHLFSDAASDILLRSQARTESLLERHKNKIGELGEFRTNYNLPASPR